MTHFNDLCVDQHINDMHRAADRARLVADAKAHSTRHPRRQVRHRLRFDGSALRRWFNRGQLGPLNNYVVS